MPPTAIRTVAALFILAGLADVGAAALHTGQASARTYGGRPVAQVLTELQRSTLRIIFSSELVPADLLVRHEPRATDPREIAFQILEPHGLTLRQGPGGTLLVVPLPRPKPQTPKAAPATPREPPPPTVPDTPPLPRVEEHVEVSDRTDVTGIGTRAFSFEPSAIQETAGNMENVLQTLRILPAAAAISDDEGRFAVRGGGPEHNVVVLDGVQIHNPYRLGEWASSFMNPATAASVSLDPSGLDARYGGRLSSVINLETRDGATDRPLAFSGALGLTSGDVLLEGRMPGTTSGSWWATARGTYYGLVSDRFIDETIPSFADVQFKTTLHPTRRTRLTFFGLGGREMRTQLDHGPAGDVVIESVIRGDNSIAAGTLRWMPSSRFISDTTVSGTLGSSRMSDLTIGGLRGFEPFDRRVRILDLALRHHVMLDLSNGHVIDAGAEARRVRSSWHMLGARDPFFWRGIGPSTWGEQVDYAAGAIDTQLRRSEVGVWVQDRLELGAVMTIEPGIRLDWNSYTREATWQPRFRASRQFGRTSAWAGVSLQAQTPSHESLQGFEYMELRPHNPHGLRNARAFQIVAGVAHPLGYGLSLRVEAYRRSFDRLLVQRPENDAQRESRLRNYIIPPDLPAEHSVLERRPTIFPESSGRGTAAGLEVLVRRQGRSVAGWFGYGLSKSTRELFGRTVPFDFDRRHAVSAALEITPWSKLRAAVTWQAASGFPITPVLWEVGFGRPILPDGTQDSAIRTFRTRDGVLTTAPNFLLRRLATYNSDWTTGYSRVDGRITYSTLGHWEFYGEVLNLFDRRNHFQAVRETDGSGNVRAEHPLQVYDTFGRMFSYGLRVKF